MAHFFATLAVAGSGDTIHFGSLEFPTLLPVGMWAPPVFEPSQAFLLGSLDFVADWLGVLHLREEATIPVPVGGVPLVSSGHPMTSMARHLRFVPSKLSAQTPL